jgi:uncharacterized protein YndB with AHSA1/START domain
MSQRSTEHSTFVIERTYDAAPQRVFAAFADPAAKRRWFGGPDGDAPNDHELDFRVGGREVNRGGPPGGPVFTFEARYYDIVPDRRIVTAYDMLMGDQRISVSLATVEFAPAGTGTKLTYTEQGAFLDGLDTPAIREEGTRELFDQLDAYLRRETANA